MLLLTLLLLVHGAPSVCDPLPSMLEQGLEARSRSELGTATTLLEEALECHPGEGAVRLELAMTLAWQQQFERSLELYRSHLAENPDDRGGRLGYGRVLAWSGSADAAARQFDRLLEADPDDTAALNGRALAAQLAWDLERARSLYRRVLVLNPDDREAAEALERLRTMRRLTADVQLGALMLSDGRRVVGNRLTAGYRLGADDRLSASASTTSALGSGGHEKSASLAWIRSLSEASTTTVGYGLRHRDGRLGHLVSAALTHRLTGRLSATVYAATDAARPGRETLARMDVMATSGPRYLLLQHYRLFGEARSSTFVVGAFLPLGRVGLSPSASHRQDALGRQFDYGVGLSAVIGSARVGLSLAGSSDNPRPRLGYTITLR